jgi:uncharacterized protein (TIGR03435 family)
MMKPTLLRVACGCLIALGAVVQPGLDAQGPVFDVVTIRRNMTPDWNTAQAQVYTQKNRVTAPSATVRDLIRVAHAYQFRPLSLIMGGPAWLDTERYEVIGQTSVLFGPPPSRGMLPSEATAMLRAMLADRFQLKMHFETRERNVYELVLDRPDGRLGPKLTVTKGDCQGSMSRYDPAISLPPCPFILQAIGAGSYYELRNVTIAQLASTLGNYPTINDLVVDRTGLTGHYDFSLRSEDVVGTTNGAATDPAAPPTDVALRQQLGLRLQRARLPVEVIVIDSVERPSAN